MIFAVWTLMILFVVGIVIWLLVTIGRRGNSKSSTKPDTPLEDAKKKYLRGEITEEELEEIAKHQL